MNSSKNRILNVNQNQKKKHEKKNRSSQCANNNRKKKQIGDNRNGKYLSSIIDHVNAGWEQSKWEMNESILDFQWKRSISLIRSESEKYRKDMDYEWMRIKERYAKYRRPE